MNNQIENNKIIQRLNRKLTIQEISNLIQSKNGKCLSTEYQTAHTKLKWQCENGHIWEATLNSIKQGTWCPYCAGRVLGTIEEMYEIAKNRGGVCLSNEYINSHSHLKWQCESGHIWKATPTNIKRGTWCPYCAERVVFTIEKMHEISKGLGGVCLSNEYINSHSHLEWQCKEGHIWKATPNSIKKGTWCPYCAKCVVGTIEKMHEIAKSRSGICLSDKYINSNTHLEWKCKEGHTWKATPGKIKIGRWCPICGRVKTGLNRRLKIEDIHSLAISKNGKCLSTTYQTAKIKLKWQCEKGHIWEALPDSVRRGSWCPICAGSAKGTIEEMCQIAKERGGLCLSKQYINSQTPLEWQCKKGHIWKAKPGHIKKGTWCPPCNGRPTITIQDLQKMAIHKGGSLLSSEYKNTNIHLEWQCKEGHIWKAAPSKIKGGRWCPKCGDISGAEKRKKEIIILQNLAQDRGGKLISKNYLKNTQPLEWECTYGHRWLSAFANIRKGTWCPECSAGLGERATRAAFELIFGVKFPSSWPDWLIGPKNTPLQLDGYSEELQIAFEHQGPQHHQDIKHFNRVYSLEERMRYDFLKKNICLKKNINLVEVPWVPNELPMEELVNFILKKCAELKIQVPQNKMLILDTKKIYTTNRNFEKLKRLNEIAVSRSGLCLSTEYQTARIELKWQCREGHIWKAIPDSIRRGSWCPQCVGHVKGTIEEMHEIAKSRGGLCLSKKYINNQSYLEWQCENGHIWKAIPNSIKRGSWCPYCSGHKNRGIEDLNEIAKINGGFCLSKEYSGSHNKHEWQCAQGHIWKAQPSNVKQGQWCPICSLVKRGLNKRRTIDEMHNFAKSKNGKCLSSEYHTAKIKLKWQCENEHIWEALPDSVRRGTWCPFCAKTIKGTIEEMNAIAKYRDGFCLSKIYVNSNSHLEWQCKEGHIWKATPQKVKQGQWCPICAKKNTGLKLKSNINDIYKLAELKNGKCLSISYENARKKLKWQCKEGHTWDAVPYSIKVGTWCPRCSVIKKNAFKAKKCISMSN